MGGIHELRLPNMVRDSPQMLSQHCSGLYLCAASWHLHVYAPAVRLISWLLNIIQSRKMYQELHVDSPKVVIGKRSRPVLSSCMCIVAAVRFSIFLRFTNVQK